MSGLGKRKRAADEEEVIRILSDIARGECGEEVVKVSERLKAAELLGKRYQMILPKEAGDGEIRVVVDYVGPGDGKV